jgi:hypothetical protein
MAFSRCFSRRLNTFFSQKKKEKKVSKVASIKIQIHLNDADRSDVPWQRRKKITSAALESSASNNNNESR